MKHFDPREVFEGPQPMEGREMRIIFMDAFSTFCGHEFSPALGDDPLDEGKVILNILDVEDLRHALLLYFPCPAV